MYVAIAHNVEGGNLLKKPSCANKKLGELKKNCNGRSNPIKSLTRNLEVYPTVIL